ncbi:MAG: sterol desaturase family protein [Betaproteobacteria bacterium]|nr:sterol desaturase family protein [Betaproteobacteria bacterium]
MELAEIIGLLIPLTYVVFWLLEKKLAVRTFPQRKAWSWLGFGFLFLIGFIANVVPVILNEDWLKAHRLLDGSGLGIFGGIVVGWLVFSFVASLWHRLEHASPFIWRHFHQLHHSPQRVDIPGSVFFHPTDMIANATLSTLITTLVLGLDPLAAAGVGYIGALAGMFQHFNIRTPQWLHWFIQRPEAHCEHHRRGVHAHNYSDFPLWDRLFGSFLNPASFDGEVGFDNPADTKVGAMFAFQDVNAPLYGADSRGANASH